MFATKIPLNLGKYLLRAIQVRQRSGMPDSYHSAHDAWSLGERLIPSIEWDGH